MSRLARPVLALVLLAVSVSLAPQASGQCVSLTALATPATENFDTLAVTGTSSTLPAGWFLSESGANANTTYAAGDGTSNAGNTYSFGTGTNTDRAFGQLLSGSLTPIIGACYTNNTGSTIGSLAISYTGEEWRFGTTGRGADRIDFQYSLDATSLTTGTWIDDNNLDFSTPNTAAAVGAVDGNAAGNRTSVSDTIASLSIASGATFWIRWTDFNVANADDGLGVDDFSLTPAAAVPVELLGFDAD